MPEIADAPAASSVSTTVERTRDSRHGDFATNIAMRLAKSVGLNPRQLAAQIIENLPASELVDKVEIAGPGFINFHVSASAFHQEIVLTKNWLPEGALKIGVTAGASTPNRVIEEVILKVLECRGLTYQGAQQGRV